MGAVEADKATAVAVLNNMHESFDPTITNVDVINQDGRKVCVVATENVPAESILLAPCIPRQSKVQEKTEHPLAVRVGVKTVRTTQDAIPNDAGKVRTERDFWLLPEFKAPSERTTAAAVAGSSASTPTIEWLWGEGPPETMHPFWAVRKLTQQQLDQEIHEKRAASAITGVPFKPPSFTCELETFEHSSVIIATVADVISNCTKLVGVPYLRNKDALVAGEELILQVVIQKKTTGPP